ncbi:MAG: sigma-E factor negative regulatory protein [Aquabacterium sp.]|nr:sigma-E factor negative regulatory protein [Aquabacterium sp.]
MTNDSDSKDDAARARRQNLSALVDGELTAEGVQQLCAVWRTEPSAREAWHAYSLIGDVMRSEDLASAAAHDERFLRDLRQCLSREPVVLAPHSTDPERGLASALPRRGSVRSWWAPAAVAAGLMVAVGAMVTTQAPPQSMRDFVPMAAVPASNSLGVMSAAPQLAVLNPPSELTPVATELVFDGQVIRDSRLDRYLLAHKQFSGSSVLGAPSGFLRNAAAEVPAR